MRKIRVLVNGLPGKMARAVAKAVAQSEDMELIPYSLTGPEIVSKYEVIEGNEIELFGPDEVSMLVSLLEIDGSPDIVVDATAPSAVKENTYLYTMNLWPFVLLTTGDHLDYIKDLVSGAQKLGGNYNAVVSPNMAEDVVMIQAMFEFAASNFPGAFKRFSAEIVESHQKGKKDTSGTAKAIVESLNILGVDAAVEKIIKRREDESYQSMGIPAEHWAGHGWHTYSLERDDKNVSLKFTHNVNGRQPYVDGTLNAIRFLFNVQEKQSSFGKVFSMIDVIKGSQ
ncbi:MAG: dihydrodipicolinate reductase C-terminal domain-containing protein [Patescibacteria group bacterium]